METTNSEQPPKENSAHSFTERSECEDIKCPFCGIDGFDKIGFKDHLIWCDDYHKTEIL